MKKNISCFLKLGQIIIGQKFVLGGADRGHAYVVILAAKHFLLQNIVKLICM